VTREVGKYQGKGLCGAWKTLEGLRIPSEARGRLAEIGNHGLARATWSNYQTAETMLWRCQKETGSSMELPLDTGKVLIFIDWLILVRRVKHRTIESYLAGLRQMHIVTGMETPAIRGGLVNLVLAGKKNMETNERKVAGGKRGRLPVTLNVMKLIKATVREAPWDKQEKLLIWSVCCLAFSGSFRIGELLANEERKFDPASTLLDEDIVLVEGSTGRRSIQVMVKWAKQDREGAGFAVEVYESETNICPVRALKKWWASGPPREKGLPAFRNSQGTSLTGKKFNARLKELLGKHIDYREGSITAHSFRGGVPSMMGSLGYSDEEIKTVGHWSSRAFTHYTKLPRTKRRQMALEIKQFQ
jgi:hypothetical protein